MSKLTNDQISALKVISAGNNPTPAKSTLNSLYRLGMIRIYPPLGWGITYSGMAALKELADGQ
ncbi:hypothetical protein L7815_010970 [Serratia marcescens]|uniref:hypothetical protein n=1 Tax=Serratia marcescens TaxID=615 RepID=UPI001EE704A9|nr:hypothetical protein [Serratia marcescens]MCG5374456.1 hypothetical protein [Serratia marcescens]